jgi:imidazolonepropionase-like amidohydrolase
MMAVALRMTKIFDECGVGLLAGTDYGGMWVIPGMSLHQEFDLLERAGLSPLTILQMTTLRPAQFLRREATMGTVEPGKDANLVLLDRNPVESAQNLHGIYAVVRGGRLYAKGFLEDLKQAVAARIAAEPDPPVSSS